MARRSAISICLVLVCACGDDGPALSTGSSSNGDTNGDGGTETNESGDTSNEGGSGNNDSATGDGDGDGNGDGDGDGDGDAPTCDDPGTAEVRFSLEGTSNDSLLDWDLLCTSGGVSPAEEDDGWQISLLDCTDENGQPAPLQTYLFVDSTPATQPTVPADIGVRLRWVQVPPFIPGRWFTLRTDPGDQLLLAGVDGPALLPFDAPGFGYEPLDVELVSIGCEPFEHISDCGLAERIAFEVAWDGQTATISDRNFGSVGPLTSYEIVVGSALDFAQPLCDDFPSQILRTLFFMIPEG